MRNEFYIKNLEILESKFPNLEGHLGFKRTAAQDKFYFDLARNEDLSFSCLNDDKKISCISAYSPSKEAKTFIEKNYNPTVDAFICFGLALGYYLEQILIKLHSKQKIFLLLPAEDIFTAQLFEKDFSDLFVSEKIDIVYAEDTKIVISKLIIRFFNARAKNINLLSLNFYKQYYLKEYLALSEFVDKYNNNMVEEILCYRDGVKKINIEYADDKATFPSYKKFLGLLEENTKKKDFSETELSFLFAVALLFSQDYW